MFCTLSELSRLCYMMGTFIGDSFVSISAMPRSASSPSSPSGGGEGGFSVVLRSYLNGLTTLKRTGSGNK